MATETQSASTVLDAAIAAHGRWKHRLRALIDNGGPQEEMSAAGRDDSCTLGRWLATHWPSPAEQKHYDKAKQLHTEFHKKAAQIAKTALAGDKAGAEKLLGVGSDYARISSELTIELMRWKKIME